MNVRELVQDAFNKRFGKPAELLVRAPGRVNLIGEHTDYNDGFVMPMAIDRSVWITLRPRSDRRVLISSLEMEAPGDFSLDDLHKDGPDWYEYLKGVAWALKEDGCKLQGWEGVMSSDVPVGAGLSSSAAIEMATARAFAQVSGFEWDPVCMAKAGRKAENSWVGVSTGIMDQMASAACKAGHALFLDCRSLQYENIPLPDGVSVVVLDTATRRGNVDSGYNERFQQCQTAARYFGAKALRDVSPQELTEKGKGLDEVVYRRARHIVTENQRVLDAIDAMRAGDVVKLGQLLDASHVSMRDDFEITNEALNIMVSIARPKPGCYGTRMTGGGFGGCAMALVDAGKAEKFAAAVAQEYQAKTGLTPSVYVCHASQGAEVVTD
ncbi:MAG TPA: galactokinase [Anaerolineales bacterium]|nr:galactokinase [Anaerolineales bacterium]